MHDIGKIGVADQILNAVGEFSEIAGYVLEHHERWDGQGYPRGLKEDEICLHARIIAIADSYDATTSYRPYGKARSPRDQARY